MPNNHLMAIYLPIFFCKLGDYKELKTIKFDNLDEAIECYGRENLIPIDNLHQVIFYTRNGCQPKFIFENETKPGKLSAWFLKNETSYVYKKWMTSANT